MNSNFRRSRRSEVGTKLPGPQWGLERRMREKGEENNINDKVPYVTNLRPSRPEFVKTIRLFWLYSVATFLSFGLSQAKAAQSLEVYDREAKQCVELSCIRSNIDTINDQILDLISKRTAFVRQAGIIKGPNQVSHDSARIDQEMKVILEKSKKEGIPPEISESVFRNLIQNSTSYQQKFKDSYFHKRVGQQEVKTTSRIPLTSIQLETQKKLQTLGGKPQNLYKLLAHQPQLLSAWIDFAYTLRRDCSTPRKLRELMILRGAQLSSSEYEWKHHLKMAREAGVTEEQISQLSNWNQSSIYSKKEKAALKFMESVISGQIPDRVASEMLIEFTPSEYVELTLTASFYAMVPRVLDSLQVPLEEEI